MKDFDWIIGLWLAWIMFLAYMILVSPSLLTKSLIAMVIGLSIHDAHKYYKTKQKLDDDDKY